MNFKAPWSNESATNAEFWSALDPIDDAITEAWEPLRGNPAADNLFIAATNAGEHGIIWVVVAVFFACRRLAKGDVEGAKRMAARFGVSLIGESLAVNGVLKGLTRRTRPHAGEQRAEGIRMPISSSMPSGHATSAMMSVSLLADEVKSAPVKGALFGAGLIVAASRIHVKIHHPTDVIAGTLLGLLLGQAIRRMVPVEPVA